MRKGMNTLLVAWAFLSVSIQAQALEGDYLAVSIPAPVGDSTTIQVTARNPDERKRMGTIAVTIDGGGPVIPENTRIYDLFPPGGAGRLAVFRPHGDGWKAAPRSQAVVPSKLHVEKYDDAWATGAEKTVSFPVLFTRPGPVKVLVRATFSKRMGGDIIVDWNFPKTGTPDEQGLPCLEYPIALQVKEDGGSGVPADVPSIQSAADVREETPVPLPSVPDTPVPVSTSETEYLNTARTMVLSKSRQNTFFKVLQSMEQGSLCIDGSWDYDLQDMFYNGDIFFWVDTSNAYTADEERFHGDLYWCGTYKYTTVKDIPKTVNAYTTDLDKAIAMVRLNFGLYDTVPSGETQSAAQEETDVTVAGNGTGFFITAEGYILTNHHVVSGAGVIAVITEGQEPRIAEIVSTDEATDLALLKVDGPAVPVTFGSTEPARLGQNVFTIGFPSPDIQGLSPKVTMGVISSLTGLMDDIKSYQIDVAVQPGNSGGPLFCATGEVIGVVFARMNDAAYTQATGVIAQKINYAIKNSHVMTFLQTQPEVYARVPRGTVGAQTQEEAVSRISRSVALIVIFNSEE